MRGTLESPVRGTLPTEREMPTSRARVGLLIATDGQPAADAAIVVGRSLAHRDGEAHEIVAVEELERFGEDQALATIQQQELHVHLARQRARTTNAAADNWPLAIAYGQPADTIVDVADQAHRRLIVMGLHVHSRTDRWLGRETVLQVARGATCPVLAVDSNRRTIPCRALVAIDFSPSSIAAAREALRITGGNGPLYLAHVAPRTHVPFAGEPQATYEPDVHASLKELRSSLRLPQDVDARTVVLRGDPAKELLAFADQEGIELIATGSRGFSPFRGPVIGAVPTALVRAARCSVLVMPVL